MLESKVCYLGLGSNIGNAKDHLEKAIDSISQIKFLEIVKKASLYLSEAWGKTDQNDFINTVICIKTTISPLQLLKHLQQVEKKLGRVKTEKWGPRIIDIDILLYADLVVNQPQLTIPHPYICERSFVLAPLFELNQQINIPKLGKIDSIVDEIKLNKGIIKVIAW